MSPALIPNISRHREIEQNCAENKQSAAASSSSLSEGTYGFSKMSPALSSPSTPSLSRRRTSGPMRRAKSGWTPQEDDQLRSAVETYKERNWKQIAESVHHRTYVQCLHRWQKVLNPNLVKGSWTQDEDDKINELVAKYGATKWSAIAKFLPGRIGKQCRERWHNHLNPMIKKDPWTLDEELILVTAHRAYGNKWADIAKFLPGRTDNSIKNHWNSSLKKKLDFYLISGELPPLPKPRVHPNSNGTANADSEQLLSSGELPPLPKPRVHPNSNGTANADSEQLLSSSNKRPDSSTKTSPETAVCTSSSPQVEPCNVEPSISQIPNSEALASTAVRESNTADAIEHRTQAPQIELICSRPDAGLKLEACSNSGEVDRNNDTSSETSLHPEDPRTFGPLYYEPVKFDDLDVLVASAVSTAYDFTQQQQDLTPPIVSRKRSGEHSLESYIRRAAKSCPSVPSILRRERETCTPLPADRLKKLLDNCCTPEEEIIRKNPEVFRASRSRLCSSPRSSDRVVLLYNEKAFDPSPPYRSRSRRARTIKSVEKQLDFSSVAVLIPTP